MATQRIPLFGSIESRDYKSFLDGVTALNMIQYDQGGTDVQYDILTDPIEGRKTGYFYPREALATSGVPASSGAGTAVHVWTGNSGAIATAFGATNSTIYNAGASLGAITGQAAFISEGQTLVPTVANLLVTNTAGGRGYFFPVGGALTEIVSANFPPKQTPALVTTGPFVQMNGYTYIMCTNGQLWNSDYNTFVNWTGTSFISTIKKPDVGVGVARYQNALVAFCLTHTEFFFDAKNSIGSPLSFEASSLNLGCANQYAFVNIGETVAWYSTTGGGAIYMLQGRSAVKISNAAVDRVLQFMNPALVRLNVMVSYSNPFLLVNSPVATFQMAYDMGSGTWSLFRFAGNELTQSDTIPSSATLSTVYVGPTVTSYYQSSTAATTGNYLTAKFDAGTEKKKFLRSIRVIGAMGSTAADTISISWTDDDYETFSTARTIDLNAGERPMLSRCGSFFKRAFRVTASNDTAGRLSRLAALELVYDLGAY